MIERLKHTTGLLLALLVVGGFYALSMVVISYATSPQNISTSVTVSSVTPTVTSVILNGNSAITLTENTSTTVDCTGHIDAPGGYWDVSAINATIYRYGVGQGCGANDNNCYLQSGFTGCVTSSASASAMDVSCPVKLWFHADSTDASSSYNGEGWACRIRATTGGGTGTGDSATQTLHSLAAQNINPTVIAYGTLSANTTAASFNGSDIVVSTTGNIIINALIKGSDMSGPGANIVPSNQHFGTSTWSGTKYVLSTSDQLLDLGQTVKPSSHSPATDVSTIVHWAIDVPNAQTPGVYTGTNTSTVISAI